MRRRGLSVIEVAIAFVLLGLALLPAIQLFSSAGQQARQTSDYGIALAVQDKVDEDLRLENWENVHLTDALPAVPSPKPVVGGTSPFFDALEDEAAPYGLILPGVDPPITAQMTTLARELASYKVGIESAAPRAAGPAGQVQDVQVTVTWEDFQHVSRDAAILTVLGLYGAAPRPEEPPVDRAAADDAVRRALYPAQSGSLASAASAAGADLAVVRAIGDVTVLAAARSQLAQAFDADVARLEAAVTAASGDLAKARAQLAVGRRIEQQVAGILQSMDLLTIPMTQLLTYQPVQLGSPPPDRNAYRTGLTYAGWQFFELADAINRGLSAYAAAYNPPLGSALPGRVRVRTFFKLLELAKLQALTCGPGDTAYVQALLASFVQEQDGRNPNFVRFARAEQADCRDAATLAAKYRAPWRKQIWDDYKTVAIPGINSVMRAP